MIKTKQELLNHFSDINAMYNNPFEYQTLSNMIDELLEQQPCEDCISREAVIKHLENITMDTNPDHYGSKDKWYQANGFNLCKVGIEMYVKNLPSVTPTSDAEDKYDIGYNCGYADAMCDIAGSEG
jgi:hypothetical protein